MKRNENSVVVLCSGFGLGFYIPGVVISEGLRRRGVTTELEVFESLLPSDKIAMVERNRSAYHASFRVALASQKVPHDIRESLNPQGLESLLAKWQADHRRHFICLSGHWVPVLDAYRERPGTTAVYADLLYLDADLSPSWRHIRKLRTDYATPYRQVRLYDSERRDVEYGIKVGEAPPVEYSARNKRLVVHGGGWGIGTFQESMSALAQADFGLDVVCYANTERPSVHDGRRYFMDDPAWRCWHRDEDGERTFPPFGTIPEGGAPIVFKRQQRQHGLHEIIRTAASIVSKPGAGTLIDSFSSATPLVMLEPFGLNEERNAEVWESCGFGIPFAAWSKAGFPMSVLEGLHVNLMRRRDSVKDYTQDYAQYVMRTFAEAAA
jgi:hypothetical protein